MQQVLHPCTEVLSPNNRVWISNGKGTFKVPHAGVPGTTGQSRGMSAAFEGSRPHPNVPAPEAWTYRAECFSKNSIAARTVPLVMGDDVLGLGEEAMGSHVRSLRGVMLLPAGPKQESADCGTPDAATVATSYLKSSQWLRAA